MQFLVCQSTYNGVQLGLFNISRLIDQEIIEKIDVCKLLISAAHELLVRSESQWRDIAFIGVNQGPAPFNTLRALMSTVNGVAYAKHIPLVGVNGLKALYAANRSYQTVILLNAFNNEVYYAYKKGAVLLTGVANVNDLLQMLATDLPQAPVTFVGNGARMFKDAIITVFGSAAQMVPALSDELSLELLAEICLNKFNQQEQSDFISPLYIKRAI